MKISLISHFWNEEYLLPFWISHHRDMFDEVIMIDYASTDSSVEIIRQLAPDWRVVPTSNSSFDAVKVDEEVMFHESHLSGWKICLNTTEFLVGNLRQVLEGREPSQILQTSGRLMIDIKAEEEISFPQSITKTKPWGIAEDSYSLLRSSHLIDNIDMVLRKNLDPIHRRRFIHSRSNGKYSVGRHSTFHSCTELITDLQVWWYGLSPWTKQGIARKLKTIQKVPKSDLAVGLGLQHNVGYEALNIARETLSIFAIPLSEPTNKDMSSSSYFTDLLRSQMTVREFFDGKVQLVSAKSQEKSRKERYRIVVSLPFATFVVVFIKNVCGFLHRERIRVKQHLSAIYRRRV